MKYHPALKAAQALFRRSGIDTHQVGTLALHVVCPYERGVYNERPLIVDIVLSHNEDGLGKFDICYLSDAHSMYKAVSEQFHGLTFRFD
jgi:hypothetical protein